MVSHWASVGPLSPGRKTNLARPPGGGARVRPRTNPQTPRDWLESAALRRVARDRRVATLPMRVDEIIASPEPTFSVEFFPPKTEEATEQLFATARSLAELELDYASVTYGAGGSTREGTVEITRALKDEVGLETMAHLSCVGETKEGISATLDRIAEAGYRERLRPARRPAPRRDGLRPARGRPRQRRRAGRLHLGGLGLHDRRRLLPRGPPRGPRPRHRPRLPEDEGRLRRLVPDHPALLRQPGLLRLRRSGAGAGDRGADRRRRHPGRQLRPDEADLRPLRRLDPAPPRNRLRRRRRRRAGRVRAGHRLRGPAVRRAAARRRARDPLLRAQPGPGDEGRARRAAGLPPLGASHR